MATAATWGVFSATWYLFAIEELGLDAAAIGIIAAVGGLSSLFAALITHARNDALRRWARWSSAASSSACSASSSSRFAPVGHAARWRWPFLIGQQLVTDPAMTAYDITDTSLRQSIVHDRQLGRVNATVTVAVLLAQLIATLAGGFIGVELGPAHGARRSGPWSGFWASSPCGSRRSGASRTIEETRRPLAV